MAAKHLVKCFYCQQVFNTVEVPYVKVNERRYAHKECADSRVSAVSKTEQSYNNLIKYIQKLFNMKGLNPKVAKQIKDFKEQYGYTYDGMLGTLIYWYEIRNATIDKANEGIGIVPYIYSQARDYYEKIGKANSLNAETQNYKAKIIEVIIQPPQPQERQPHLFKFEEDKE